MLSWFGFPRSGAWDKDLDKYVLLKERQSGGKNMMKEEIKENMQRERAKQGWKVKFQSWLNPQMKDGFWSINCSVWVSSYFNNDPGYFNKHTWQRQSIATTGKDQGQRNSYFLLFGVKTDITTLEKSLILHYKAEHVCAPWPCIFSYMT